MQSLHQVRAVALTDYVEVARSLELDPMAMLAQAQLTPAMLEDPEARLPASSVASLLEDSAAIARRDDLAILLAMRRSFESLGPITRILLRLQTIREVVQTTATLRRELNDVFEIDVAKHEGHEFVVVKVLPQFGGFQATALVMAMTHRLLCGASHGGWTPHGVYFEHHAPADGRPYASFFGAPVRFGSAFNGFGCAPDSLDRRYGGNPILAAIELTEILEARLSNLSREALNDGMTATYLTLVQQVKENLRNSTNAKDLASD